MTTVQITLPDQLAQDAERAGLLAPESLEQLLREQLRESRLGELTRAIERMNAGDDTPPMSPEDVAEEIALIRAERRAEPSR